MFVIRIEKAILKKVDLSFYYAKKYENDNYRLCVKIRFK